MKWIVYVSKIESLLYISCTLKAKMFVCDALLLYFFVCYYLEVKSPASKLRKLFPFCWHAPRFSTLQFQAITCCEIFDFQI